MVRVGFQRLSMTRLHLFLAAFWAAMVVPAVLWWSDSVLFVSIVSLYANFVGHLAAGQAAHAEECITETQNPKKAKR